MLGHTKEYFQFCSVENHTLNPKQAMSVAYKETWIYCVAHNKYALRKQNYIGFLNFASATVCSKNDNCDSIFQMRPQEKKSSTFYDLHFNCFLSYHKCEVLC
jgi:hypothetical protein